MKILKLLGIGILSIIVLLVVVSFFLSSTAHVERTTVINAPVDVVFGQVNNLKNWGAWSPWAKNDPSMKLSFNEIEAGAGASYSWEGDPEKSGKGVYTILESVENESIKSQLEFEGMGTSTGSWKFEGSEEGTKVTWAYDADVSSPPIMGKYMGMMMDGFLGAYFEEGLRNIKEIAENAPTPASAEISEVEVGAQWFLGIREEVDMAGMKEVHGRLYGELMEYTKGNEIEAAGMPLAVYHNFGSVVDIECGIPVSDSIPGNDRIALNKVAAGKAVKAIHRGHYERLGTTHQAIMAWMAENDLTASGAPWEIYVTDPGEVENPDEWITEIYYPID